MLKPENVQIINTKSPVGDSHYYTINFSIQSDTFSCSSARVLISKDELFTLTEGQKAQKVIDLVRGVFEPEATEE